MIVEQLYTNCLAEAAYYIESNGEAAVIDPLREPQPYIDLAMNNGTTIKYIFETHIHADFVSGHLDLAKKTGAKIVFGPTTNTNFDAIIAKDNQEFKVGNITLKLLHTPGHTLESSTYLLIDEEGKETALFTGDTLFLGDVGRPDLAVKTTLSQEDLAGMLFDSLHNRIMPLDNSLIIYPAHGAGSSCGKNLSSETIGTLGEQKKTNYALQSNLTRNKFIKELTTGILDPPQYFAKNALMNQMGYNSFDDVLYKGNKGLSLEEFKAEVNSGALILDVRNEFDFINGFIPNSLFIGLNGTFAMWVGALIENINQKIVLICPEGKEKEAVTRLARVGYDNTVGFLKGGIETYSNTGENLETIASITAKEVAQKFKKLNIVDVRKLREYESEHVETAEHYALDYINNNLTKLKKNLTYHIHCAGGYRSVIAISLLMKNGYSKLIDISGGFDSISKTNIPKTVYICPSTI